jgi:hypothetical protein
VAEVAEVSTIIGSSPESFAKSAVVENDRITEFRTIVNIAFAVGRGGLGG